MLLKLECFYCGKINKAQDWQYNFQNFRCEVCNSTLKEGTCKIIDDSKSDVFGYGDSDKKEEQKEKEESKQEVEEYKYYYGDDS